MQHTGKGRWPLWIIVPLLVLALALAGLAGFVVWGLLPAAADGVAIQALESDELVEVRQGPWISFLPRPQAAVQDGQAGAVGAEAPSQAPGLGLVFYPGGHVDARAYAPALKALARAGYPVFLCTMPLSLAILDQGAADRVIAENPRIKRWVIAGHSLGGAMAASYLAGSPAASPVRGLLLWGAYSPSDLSARPGLRILSIAGSEDGLSTKEKISANAKNLGPGARFVEIPGANHAQFGSYGPQSGDRPASISPAEQRAAVVAASLEFLHSLEQE